MLEKKEHAGRGLFRPLFYLNQLSLFGMAHLTKDPAAAARWITVYPAYLDSSLSIAEGRRLPIAKVSFS